MITIYNKINHLFYNALRQSSLAVLRLGSIAKDYLATYVQSFY